MYLIIFEDGSFAKVRHIDVSSYRAREDGLCDIICLDDLTYHTNLGWKEIDEINP